MTGMGGSLGSKSAYVTDRFNEALWHQLVIVTLVVLAVAVAAGVVLSRRHEAVGPSSEPGARKLLRIGFGALWVVAGLLQLQPQMPIGLPTQVVGPTAQAHRLGGGPRSLRHRRLAAAPRDGRRSRRVVPTRARAVAALRRPGRAPRAGRSRPRLPGARHLGLRQLLWGLFAAISWMTGARGATFFYFFAGVALALPEAWLRRRSIG